jgi:predicted amidohydrolase YtcJ
MHTARWDAFLPEEAVTLEAAVRAYTAGSAYVNHLDRETGTIEVGKLADLVVIDRDLFDANAGSIGQGRVLATFVGGTAVFEDAALG